jgi:N-acetylglucosaminyldiphosphoundecaprenol N-acetyl-beta-D-mannosaminyltransferase
MKDALDEIKNYLLEDKLHIIYTPNAEITMAAQRDENFKNILNSSDMTIPDGAGVILSSKILNIKLPEKVPGFDLTKNSFSIKRDKKTKYFFFGGKPGIAEKAVKNVENEFPNVEIVGCNSGYFAENEEDVIIDKINASGAEILLVALGAPKQENWIYKNKDKLKVKICIGVGGTIDILSGTVELTPDFFRRNGLEWLYRLYKEPWRFKRMLDLPRFILLSFKVRIFGS